MAKGWIIGTRDFGKAMIQEHRELATRGPQLASELNAAKEAAWTEALRLALRASRRTLEEARAAPKSARLETQISRAAPLAIPP